MPVKRKNTRNRKKLSTTSHIKSSLVYVAPHKHTGKRLTHHHTSHGVLLLLLIVAGIILFFSLASLEAAGITKNGNLTITATVPGAPPTTGAVIKVPATKTKVKQSLAQVSGTCPTGTIVAVYNNGQSSSSTSCAPTNSFQTVIQLKKGINTIQAQNYDTLNQAGPVTDQIEIAFEPDEDVTPIPAVINLPEDIVVDTSIPTVVAPQPALNPCFVEPTTSPDLLGVWAPCVTRNIFVGEKLQLPVLLRGGLSPYALSVDWGDSDTAEIFSFAKAGRYTLSHTYKISQVKSISMKLADATGETYQTEAVILVNDNTGGFESESTSPLESIKNIVSSAWFEASVPIYWAAVSLFMGFWVGDIFQRALGKKRI